MNGGARLARGRRSASACSRVRRRSVAVGAVDAAGAAALGGRRAQTHGVDDAVATGALGVRAVAARRLLVLLISAHPRGAAGARRLRPAHARRRRRSASRSRSPGWCPTLGLGDRNAERAVLALSRSRSSPSATRRATVFQIVALVQIDNALALAALAGARGLPALVELGVAGDLLMVVLVAALLHTRIFASSAAATRSTSEQLRD